MSENKFENWTPSKKSIREFFSALHIYEDDFDDVEEYEEKLAEFTDRVIYGNKEPLVVNENYHFDHQEQHGGEDEGSEFWVVHALVETKTKTILSYWKIPGWYQSFEGHEMEPENTHEVFPITKIVKDWATKKPESDDPVDETK